MDRKSKLTAGLDLKKSLGVEIGALCRPIISAADGPILYIDHADTATLREKYKNDPNVDVDMIVNIDGVWGDSTLGDCMSGRNVDYVIASHVIEHVPDLITWLRELESILSPNGQIRLAIPDRRYTFDYIRTETRMEGVLNSHLVHARIPQPFSILDHVINVVKVNAAKAWSTRLDKERLTKHHSVSDAIQMAKEAIEDKTYHDVHCWVFTPKSFATLIGELGSHGFINLACERFFDTDENSDEFFVSMRPTTDRAAIVRSWDHMRSSVRQELSPKDTQIDKLREEIRSVKDRLAEAQAELSRLRAVELDRNANLTLAIERVKALENSTSWKLTRPLRKFVEAIRR
jgi:predicted SAM-dependent methyltransferase